eukprot:5904290-Amphidinium_carterae.2
MLNIASTNFSGSHFHWILKEAVASLLATPLHQLAHLLIAGQARMNLNELLFGENRAVKGGHHLYKLLEVEHATWLRTSTSLIQVSQHLENKI